MEDGGIEDGQPAASELAGKPDQTPAATTVKQDDQPSTVRQEDALKVLELNGKRTKRRNKLCYTRDPGMFWVSVVAAAAVIVYAYYARQQALDMKAAADAATRASKVAEDTLNLVEAPDIEVETECSTPSFGLETRITLHYRNYGRTRAQGFSGAFSIGIPGKPLIQPSLDKDNPSVINAIGPGASYPSGTTPTVREILTSKFPTVPPEESLRKIISGRLQFGFWGILQYSDVREKIHQIDFYYVWDRVWPDKCIFTAVRG